LCDNNNHIRRLSGAEPPAHSSHHTTFSTVFSAGHGFHVLEGDAISSVNDNTWHDLWFDWNAATFASALTNAGTQRALRVQNPKAFWPHMLLPNIYHGPPYTVEGFGGLTGELAIFLALVAMSMKPERLLTELPKLTEGGKWGLHGYEPGCKLYKAYKNWF
jgi:hypothetical protein